jgi:hypothetical protein
MPLASTDKAQCVDESRIGLETLRADAKNGFINIIAADESWSYWSCEHTSQGTTSRDLAPSRTGRKINSKKSMLVLVFSG